MSVFKKTENTAPLHSIPQLQCTVQLHLDNTSRAHRKKILVVITKNNMRSLYDSINKIIVFLNSPFLNLVSFAQQNQEPGAIYQLL